MTISYQWLLEYLPEPLPIKDLSNILTSIGLEVEGIDIIEAVKGSLNGLVIGEVLSCEKHPNADKLKVTKVNIGTPEHLNIVCGAPNVARGQKVVVAPVGTTVHPLKGEAFQINKAKIRGESSEGMICAEDEIGLGESHDGIIILPETAVVGALAKDHYKIPVADHAIHIGLTPNRSDAMSHIGVAKDVCAYITHHRKPAAVVVPQFVLPEIASPIAAIKVHIEAVDACPRYAGISIANVKIGTSPVWLRERLHTIGLRPINNVVDITNFVLHEYGQPLHAFDADTIKGNAIHVRFLPEGSNFTTLDEKVKKLRNNDLMICDANEGMCIAGVFGGLHSGVTNDTKNIFLESAYFEPRHIRSTSLHHGLRTDAATHFEKGVDINNIIPALERAAALICEITGGTIASEIIDVYPKHFEPVIVNVTYDYINKLSGKHYEAGTIKKILTALGFVITEETEAGITLEVPSNKTDVSLPADIVEEILRIDGLDNIAISGRLNISLPETYKGTRKIKNRVAKVLIGMGFTEIITNSITNSKYYPENNKLVKMLNSLSSELDVMRPTLLESGLEVIHYNCNRKCSDLALFEFGKVYSNNDGKYIETDILGMWLSGNIVPNHWNHKAKPADIFHLKSVIQNLLDQSGVKKTSITYHEDEIVWKWKNETLCTLTSIDNNKLSEFNVKQDVCFASLNLDLWTKTILTNTVQYHEVPKYPAVHRDLAIVIDQQIKYAEVEKTTEQLKLDGLHSFDLFDVFENEKLGAGKKSFALSYTFQLQDRTLTDAEIGQMMQQLMNAYKTKLQAQIRE